ncbi:insulin-like isoform X1 [Camponotus floridanus]|nr:insulin [Camponotus floridanus]XP_025265745.1 insulin-like [Camponotus floridanus]XP_025265746.1 insulin-like isoform X1 [Camponotus floridanus]
MSTSQLNVIVSLIIPLMLFVLEANAQQPRRYCGKELSDALNLVCGGVFNTPKPYNRDYQSNDPNNSLVQEKEAVCDPSRNMSEKTCYQQERGYQDTKKSKVAKKVGVADECCSNKCTLQNLSMYCAERTT